MFDIITDIWKNPGAVYSPFVTLSTDGDRDSVLGEINELHKKGVDALLLDCEASVFGISPFADGYFDALCEVLEYTKSRFMLAVLPDFSSYADSLLIAEDKRYSARAIYASPASEPVPEDEELLFRVYLSFDGEGKLSGVELGKADGYEEYNLILGYMGDGYGRDILNPTANEEVLRVLKKVTEATSPYLGSTVVGFYVKEHAKPEDGKLMWSYDTVGYFMEARGEFEMLPALLFETKDKKLRREAEYRYGLTMAGALAEGYYSGLEKFTLERGLSLMGVSDTPSHKFFGTPGVRLGHDFDEKEAAGLKCASDSARHRGKAHTSATLTGLPETACGFADTVGRLATLGASMTVVPHSLYDRISPYMSEGDVTEGRREYKKLSAYIKRLMWLGSMGTNNPTAAVLCSPEYIPTAPTAPLYKEGFTFNYLTLDDLMERASVVDGTIRIDRYAYKTVLIDGRLRMNAEVVKKVGQFVTEGGGMFRGSDFVGYMKKHEKRTTYLSGKGSEDIRITRYTKSGCPFVLLVNESDKAVDASLVTDLGMRCHDFGLADGKISELSCTMADEGFEYKLRLGAHSARVLGFDPDYLPVLGEERAEAVSEIVSLSDNSTAFVFRRADGARAVLSVREMRAPADIFVNSERITRFTLPPYECDITDLLADGENKVTYEPIGAVSGCTVRITKHK